MSNDNILIAELREAVKNQFLKKFTIEQRVGNRGLIGKRTGMIYVNMPRETIGKLYKITLELIG